ncbi:hypothetical protein ACU610_07020 [Geodermatophilus sp. URMC 61]
MDGGSAPAGIPGDGDGDFPAGSLPATRPGARTAWTRPAAAPAGEQLALL